MSLEGLQLTVVNVGGLDVYDFSVETLSLPIALEIKKIVEEATKENKAKIAVTFSMTAVDFNKLFMIANNSSAAILKNKNVVSLAAVLNAMMSMVANTVTPVVSRGNNRLKVCSTREEAMAHHASNAAKLAS